MLKKPNDYQLKQYHETYCKLMSSCCTPSIFLIKIKSGVKLKNNKKTKSQI